MNLAEIKEIVFQQLSEVAPEMEPDEIDPEEDLRDELDIDSMDFMRVTVALGKQLQIEIPDADQSQITTLDSMLAYLQQKVG